MTSATAAARLAAQLIDTVKLSESAYRRAPLTAWTANRLFSSYVDAALAGEPHYIPGDVAVAFARLPAQWRREISFSMQDVAMRRLWQQHRIVHTFDLNTWEAIGSADPASTIPPDVLGQLPYPNPLVVFPEPILLDHGERERQQIVAVFVTGVRPAFGEHRMLCSSSNLSATGWNLTFAGLVEDAHGRAVMLPGEGVRDVMWTRCSLRLDETTTLGGLTQRAIQQFDPFRDPKFAFGDHAKDLPVLLARAVNAIVYLCARNADLRPVPAPPSRSRGRKSGRGTPAPKPPRVIEVGYRVGAALRAWQRTAAQRPVTSTGRTVSPHVRRSHPHTFRYGPGRSQAYVKWLWPIPVNMEGGDAAETAIIPIREE